jgi:hypothetical protein
MRHVIPSEALSAINRQPSGIGAPPQPRILMANRCGLSAYEEIPCSARDDE